ncbi:hypothetical protein [Flavobacterium sp.]|uniref:hypothetical protein n=2 Tax=Flavobacterium sp. TaxID=239 RepID=UPI0040486E6F
MKNILLFFLIFLSIEYINAQDNNFRELIESNFYDDKFTLEKMSLKGKVKSITTYISEVLENPKPQEYKKSKLYFFDFEFNKNGKLVSRGIIEGPSYFPKEYSFKDTIIYTFEGKLKEIIRLRDGFRKNNIYFDSNENKIKDISSTIDSPSIDKMNTYYFKSYKYDNNNNNILEEIEYEPITGNDTLKKDISNKYTYTYEGKNIISIKQEIEIINVLSNSFGKKKGEVPIITIRKYNDSNKIIEEKCESKVLSYTTKYEYDSNGDLKKIIYNSTEVKSITTFKNNLIVNKILQNTKKGINENNTYEYEFDSKGNVIKIVFTNTNNYSKIVLVERKIIYYE